ncbi:MAG: TetR/AcrR family transcriptional regulator [Candidatus Dormibacteraeota bacterium]|nr:TetR/AcrR family transcriptional regulator [Candidatus Dormibacteraeota bacterium]
MPTETREKILQAAFRTLSRMGYAAATIKDIADEAGVAPGLVYYYFDSKLALVMAVLAMACEDMSLNEAAASTEGILDVFEQVKAMLRESEEANRLFVQLIGVGLHDREVGAGILDFVRQDRGGAEQLARRVLDSAELPASSAAAMAAAAWGGVLGIMIQKLLDPQFDADAAVDALAAMAVAAVTRPAVTRPAVA